MIKLAVIADDLTGANDTGVQFVKYGMRVQVLLSTQTTGATEAEPDILVVDTDSRALTAAQAQAKVAAAASMLLARTGGNVPMYKKVDSTLRGNIGAEIDAAMEACGSAWAAVAPAFPKTGRWTVGGYHLMNGLPLTETPIANDPRTPVKEPVLPVLLAAQSANKVGHVELRYVSLGKEALLERIGTLRSEGCRIVSFDATTEQHLLSIAQAVSAVPDKVLWVGSAGLAEAMPKAFNWNPEQKAVETNRSVGGPVLVVAGSVSPVTANQIATLVKERKCRLVSFDAAKVFANLTHETERCADEVWQALNAGFDTILVSAADASAVEEARKAGAAGGLNHSQVSAQIAEALANLVQKIVSGSLAGMFLTGGDTAIAICRQLGVSAIEVLAEVAPGIPLGQLVGGPQAGMRVVTKAGAFGNDRAIMDAMDVLKGNKE